MKVPITISINAEKKGLFESLKSVHGKTFTDLMDEALDNLLMDIAPDTTLELQIQEKELELAELRQKHAEAKYLVAQQTTRKQFETAKAEIQDDKIRILESMRISKYEEAKKSLAYQVKKRTIDWKVISNVFEFPTRAEAKNFVITKLTQDKLI